MPEPLTIPPEFYRKIGDKTLLEVAAILNEGVDQNFNDGSENSFLRYRLVHDPSFAQWRYVDRQGAFARVGDVKTEEDVLFKNNPQISHSDNTFGPRSPFAFYVPLPPGFVLLNVTNKQTDPHYTGYDAIAAYNSETGDLIFVNKAADDGSLTDQWAALHDGGKQISAATNFYKKTLEKLAALPDHPPFTHILFTGYSMGCANTIAQAAAHIESNNSTPFDVITFDSIGSKKLIADHHMSDATVTMIKAHHLGFFGGGWSRDYPLNIHLFAEQTVGTRVNVPYIAHEMESFLRRIPEYLPAGDSDKKTIGFVPNEFNYYHNAPHINVASAPQGFILGGDSGKFLGTGGINAELQTGDGHTADEISLAFNVLNRNFPVNRRGDTMGGSLGVGGDWLRQKPTSKLQPVVTFNQSLYYDFPKGDEISIDNQWVPSRKDMTTTISSVVPISHKFNTFWNNVSLTGSVEFDPRSPENITLDNLNPTAGINFNLAGLKKSKPIQK